MQTELLPKDLGNRDTIRQNATRNTDVVNVPLDKIIVREGFNKREDYGDIEGLADSILNNGQVNPCRVDVLKDGTFALTDGHRRHRAYLHLQSKGYEGLTIQAIVNSSKTTEEQRILQMFTTQDSKPLVPHEIAELFKELLNLGYRPVDIARKLGKSDAYVSQMLEYASEAPAIKEQVKAGKLKVSTVLKIKKSIPSTQERIKAVNEAVNKNKGTKVTTEKVEAAAGINKKKDKAESIADALIDMLELQESEKQRIVLLLNKFI